MSLKITKMLTFSISSINQFKHQDVPFLNLMGKVLHERSRHVVSAALDILQLRIKEHEKVKDSR